VFTPNNDDKNETFHFDTACVEEVTLVIYNRWGREMIRLSSPLDKWDGTFQGRQASEGIYYYAGSATLVNGDFVALKGFVSLMR
jgi:gliding motility-associated-like protein